ncbi:putative odorant receptor 85d [Drosophila pseudoobscura]|uniref:Odorant receptor n=1 Tax=Drosophila pseudoobscura pseudoobscura TaxID=46245 RepID=A0A6I8UR80_DROPS|nr:putative odorant receptor 85d [Drosophila pseudoobscura]
MEGTGKTPSTVEKAEKSEPITTERFLRYANIFYLSIGMEAYDHQGRRKMIELILRCIFIALILNLNAVLLSELIYVFLAIGKGTNFLEATMNLSFIGFVIVGDLKVWHIWRKRDQLTNVVREMEKLHPKEGHHQKAYDVESHLSGYSRYSKFYFGMHLVLIWTYNLYWAVYYLVCDFWLGIRHFVRMLPYYCWVPWDWSTNSSYYLMYVSQNMAGQTCLSGQLAADLMMCALVTLLVMHFIRLGRGIEEHVAGLLSPQQDLEFLQAAVVYHQRLLQLCHNINEIFGVSLLCNFVSSAFIICFVGFQMTIGGKIDNLVMLVLFLFCALVQVFMITTYAQRLLDASERIGEAVYNHDWFQADLPYRKMLIFMVRRSQQASRLKATIFLNVSLVTVSDLLQLSYKFFALLRTMYVK